MKARPWGTTSIIIIGAVLAVLCIFWDTTLSAVATWAEEANHSHGFLVLPISAYLVWTFRQRVAALVPIPNLWGLSLLILFGCMWVLGNLTGMLIVQQLALVTMIQGLVWTVLGTRVARALLFPLTFLFFAVPFGERLEPPLQDFTAWFAVIGFQISGIPILWEGRFLSLPSGTWHIAEPCAGVQYVIASMFLGFLYAVVTYQRWRRCLGFMLASVCVPILANGVRAYSVMMVAHFSDNKYAVGVDHFIGGGLFFGVVMLVLFWVGSRWRETDKNGVPSVSSNLDLRRGDERTSSHAYSPMTLMLTAACGVGLLALAPLSARELSHEVTQTATLGVVAPEVTPPWKKLAEYAGRWVPNFVNPDAEILQSYKNGARQVQLYIAYYASQRQGAEVINDENYIAGGFWIPLLERHAHVSVDGSSLNLDETILRSSNGKLLVWSWYWVAGEYTSNPFYAKFLQAKGLVLGKRKDAAVIAVATDFEDQRSEATKTIKDFLAHSSSLRSTLISVCFPNQ